MKKRTASWSRQQDNESACTHICKLRSRKGRGVELASAYQGCCQETLIFFLNLCPTNWRIQRSKKQCHHLSYGFSTGGCRGSLTFKSQCLTNNMSPKSYFYFLCVHKYFLNMVGILILNYQVLTWLGSQTSDLGHGMKGEESCDGVD